VSRHRSPSGRQAHPRRPAPVVAIPGAPPRHAAAQTAVRNGLTAAAVAGSTLALVVPVAAVTVGGTDTSAEADAAVLQLAADQSEAARIAPAGTAGSGGGRFEPVALPMMSEDGTTMMLASVAPVPQAGSVVPPELDAAELLKAVGLADVARKAEEERAGRAAAARCDTGLGGLGRVKPRVREAARFLSCLYGQPTLIGVAGRSGQSDHPSGLAVDFMTRAGQGDRLAQCALRNKAALGVSYVIWKQRINYGDGWEHMSDRGGETANHYDHVHVSFRRSSPSDIPSVEGCA